MSTDDAKSSAAWWRTLAKQERERPTWDRHYLPQIAEEKAQMFERAAQCIEKTEKTGIAHCACHLIPLTECAKLKRVR